MDALNTTRPATPQRWLKAAERAENEGVRILQIQGTGQWIATSGKGGSAAYELQITGNVAHDCDCLAGLNGDPVCKHRAAFYLLIGALMMPEPEPPAPVRMRTCPECGGGGVEYNRELERLGLLYPPCLPCRGTGQIADHAA